MSSSSSSPQPNHDNNNQGNKNNQGSMRHWRDRTAKGVGQVIFLNSTQSGALLLGSLALGDPYLASLAATGSLISSFVAKTILLNNNKDKDNDDNLLLDNGLWAYNGCLMGCVSAVFVAPHQSAIVASATGIISTVTGATAATLVTAVMPSVLPKGMPQWTFAFNIVALTQLARLQPHLESSSSAADAAATTVPVVSSILSTPLVGLSQIFLVENAWSGAGVVVAIATYSPLLAGHALAGSTVGALTGLALGGTSIMEEITTGLWSYNSALTSLGVGVFFKHNRESVALSLAGAAATAAVFGGVKVVLANAAASPCLTLPFCVTMSGCWLLAAVQRDICSGLQLASEPHSPEHNQ